MGAEVSERMLERLSDKAEWIASRDPSPMLVWVVDLSLPKFILHDTRSGYVLDVLYSGGYKYTSARTRRFEEWTPILKAILRGSDPKNFDLKTVPLELPGDEWEKGGHFETSDGNLIMRLFDDPLRIRVTFFGSYTWATQVPYVRGPLIKLGNELASRFYRRTLVMSELDGRWKRVE